MLSQISVHKWKKRPKTGGHSVSWMLFWMLPQISIYDKKKRHPACQKQVDIRHRGCSFWMLFQIGIYDDILHAKLRWTFGIAGVFFKFSQIVVYDWKKRHLACQTQVDIRYRRCFFKCFFKSTSMTEKTASCLPNAGGHSVSRMLFLNALQCHLRLERSVSIFLHVFYFFEYIKF